MIINHCFGAFTILSRVASVAYFVFPDWHPPGKQLDSTLFLFRQYRGISAKASDQVFFIVETPVRVFNSSDRFTFSTAGVGTAADWVATSDRRLKIDIMPVSNQLNKVKVIAELVRNYNRTDTKKNETGFVAQDLLAVAPEYVVVPDDTAQMMSVNYAKMVVPLYKAVTQLSAEIDALKKEIAELKALIK